MKYSILIPWRNNGDPWRGRNFKSVMRQWEFLSQKIGDAEICLGDSAEGPFNRCEARNKAYKDSMGDFLIFADADTLISFEGLSGVLKKLDTGQSLWGFPYLVYYNATSSWTELFCMGKSLANPLNEGTIDYEHRLLDSVGGAIIVRRDAFERIQGYDERFMGWGYEDRAFVSALTALAGTPYRTSDYVIHLWHKATEESRFGQPQIRYNEHLYHRYQSCENNPAGMLELIKEHSAL